MEINLKIKTNHVDVSLEILTKFNSTTNIDVYFCKDKMKLFTKRKRKYLWRWGCGFQYFK